MNFRKLSSDNDDGLKKIINFVGDKPQSDKRYDKGHHCNS